MGDWQQFFSEKGLFHSYYFEEEEEEGVEWKYTLYGVQDQLEKEGFDVEIDDMDGWELNAYKTGYKEFVNKIIGIICD